jgi:hypothetical protein
LDLPELQLVFREYADVPLVSISNAQRTPVEKANFLATVYHGISSPRSHRVLPHAHE